MSYKGTKWYKCDFHLHTTTSKCFQDQSVTAEQWVQKAIEQGLDCVAVTDHNTGTGIDAIKEAAKGTKLTVFSGVEITCDTSKIHLLILFDVTKSSEDVRDFLVKCEIPRDHFGEQLAFTSKNIFDVAEIAHKENCLIIPAHIDEYNGLCSTSHAILKKFYELEYVNAVHVVHKVFFDLDPEITDEQLKTYLNAHFLNLKPAIDYATINPETTGKEQLKIYLNTYYSNPKPAIDDSTMKSWWPPVKLALDYKKAILTFSDNPHEPNNSKHGLWGIGYRYTWIKMEESPTLESLRQALLLPDLRIRNDFHFLNIPYKIPDLWIKSIKIATTKITEPSGSFIVEFSPQLTTIIGGRGSGKSSILRFIRGVFNRISDISALDDILKDQSDFYKRHDSKSELGVLDDNSHVEVLFFRNDIEYRITASQIENSSNQAIKIEKFNSPNNIWEIVTEDGFIDFFEFEHYSQKQIYEIAQNPNSLRERIDKAIEGLDEIKNERDVIKRTFLEKSTVIRTMQQQISGKGKLQTEIKDLDERIKIYQQSDIANLLTDREKFLSQEKIISEFTNTLQSKEILFDNIIKDFDLTALSFENFIESHQAELKESSKLALDELEKVKLELLKLKNETAEIRANYESQILVSSWKKAYGENFEKFNFEKENLKKQGVDDIENFEKLTTTKAEKERELVRSIEIEKKLSSEIVARTKLQGDYLSKAEEITKKRSEFVDTILKDQKVKIKIKPFRSQIDLEQKLRAIFQREAYYEKDIDFLVGLCFNGIVKDKIKEVREIILKLRKGEQVDEVSGHFKNLILGLNDAQLDEIELLLPEDEIEVSYKPAGSSKFKSLSVASAGQKTTAILTFILSYGKVPLILDQPEDDLDNRLVYELVVDRLKQAKEKRQIIVVTHNANIPVNGDAEYIVSLDSESKKLQVLTTGSVDQQRIKKEICAVMEGSEYAFEMRSKRYKMIGNK